MRAIAPDGGLVNVISIDVADGAVQRIHSMLNPDKLGHLGPLSDVGAAARGALTPHPGAANRTVMTPATPSARRRGDGIVLSMLNATPNSRSRRLMDHSHRVAVVREIPRPAAALAW